MSEARYTNGMQHSRCLVNHCARDGSRGQPTLPRWDVFALIERGVGEATTIDQRVAWTRRTVAADITANSTLSDLDSDPIELVQDA